MLIDECNVQNGRLASCYLRIIDSKYMLGQTHQRGNITAGKHLRIHVRQLGRVVGCHLRRALRVNRFKQALFQGRVEHNDFAAPALGGLQWVQHARAVLDYRGIPLDLDGEVNQFTITEAINSAVMPDGVKFENLFDKEAVRRDVKRLAIDYAAEAFGFEGSLDADQLKAELMREILAEVKADIASGAGDYIDATKGLALAQRLIDAPEPFDWQAPRVFSKKAEKNRARQEVYRASHSRTWTAK